MSQHSRSAGISVPLFSLRSSRSWGIGEIGDIPAMAEWLRAAHQSVLQILPLNELAPSESSPYSALSAMAIDPQFISIWMMDEAHEFEREWRAEIDHVRQTPTVNYKAVRELKSRALRTSFERFLKTDWLLDTGRSASFRDFIAKESWWLDEYSLYRALRADAGERSWPEWPSELRDREPSAMARARERLAGQILYYQYVQWIASRQWQSIREATRGIHILGDFPFMVTLDSADVWSRREDFMLDASVGTPPDAFSETGQEWGLPPYNWDEARRNNFAWLRMRARRQANLYDGFRVDHLVGFYRTYVRPFDGRQPFFMPANEPEQTALGETVLRIIMETNADVSVEDLGTVPPFVRKSIARLGVPGYKVWRWEDSDPALYPPLSVAMTGTHDTDTLTEWWETLSPEERTRFGVEAERYDDSVRDRIIEKIYNAGSNLVLLPIQDVFGWRDRINLPATVGDRNWTYVLPWPSDTVTYQPDAIECANRLAELSSQTGRWQPSPQSHY
ncbi:MAG TPA: 4-alpha-glucanotransferase [Vicinamibacterales bacterium]|nr:4-alpha-glucanotransferase [Vicinamibacterales bacterium]